MAGSSRVAGLRPPFDAEAASEAVRRRYELQAAAEEAARQVIPSGLGDADYGTRVSDAEWYEMYARRAFPGRWAAWYRQIRVALKRQYASARGTSQYRLLVDRTASLATLVHLMEASRADTMLIVKRDAQLRAYLSQLQRYTESEKHEINLTNTVTLTALTKVISIAETTILDAGTRSRFLAELSQAMTGSMRVGGDGSNPLLIAQNAGNQDVIEAAPGVDEAINAEHMRELEQRGRAEALNQRPERGA